MTDLVSPGNRAAGLEAGRATTPGAGNPRALCCVPLRGNLVLARFPGMLSSQVADSVRAVWYAGGEVLREADPEAKSLVFPMGAVVSVMLELEDGLSPEISSIGREGVLGLPSLTGIRLTGGRLVVTVPGEAVVVPVDVVKQWIRTQPGVKAAISGASFLQVAILTRLAACNGKHLLDQRLARWLLFADDRLEVDAVETLESRLAGLLNVRRPSISIAMHEFRNRGWIAHSRGVVQLLDREALVGVACSCYREVRRLLREHALGLTRE